jgi:Domain of unknown function (DUF1911)/Domain of unknown function (DUF1910)
MSFFKKLFNSGLALDVKYKMRVSLKNQSFFISAIDNNEIIIKNYEKSNAEMLLNGTIRAFNYWSIATQFLKKIELMYSLGKPVSEIAQEYEKAISFYIKGWDEKDATYADMIEMISLAILFVTPTAQFNLLVDYVDKTDRNPNLEDWKPDYLIGYMLKSKNPEQLIPETVLLPAMYQKLVDITKLNKIDAEKGIAEYLNVWYTLHKYDPWYDTHKRQKGFSGYWCWDAAAIVKIMGLDDSSFKDNQYYPYDMVHWKENES